MLTGQLYYYEAALSAIPHEITQENISTVELLGFNPELVDKKLSGVALIHAVKNTFSQSYLSILRENKLSSYSVWNGIVGARVPQEQHTQSVFEKNVLDWSRSSDIQMLDDLLSDSLFLTAESDIALAYGLKVLSVLSSKIAASSAILSQVQFDTQNIEENNKVLVVTEYTRIPLYAGFGCNTLPLQPDIYKEISLMLTSSTEISLVLTEEYDTIEIKKLKKQFPEVLFAPLELQNKSKQGFFDTIVRETLGLRL